jgi:hypothetical protein
MYSPGRQWKKGDLPFSPFVSIAVGTYSAEKGEILLTAELMTDQEIDYAVESLKAELEEFRKKAKLKLTTLREKMLKT